MNTRIKELRNLLKLSQLEFAKKIGMKQGSLSDIERGNSAVTEKTIITISYIFDVNEEWLKSGTGEIFKTNQKHFNEFFSIFNKLDPILQDFLIQTAQNLLDIQNKF